MIQTCRHCQQALEIDDLDQAYYTKMQVPPPTLCPDCRLQRRLNWRVERTLYRRKCDLTGKECFSVMPQNTPFTVYSRDAWWSDAWNPLMYGRTFDFQRPFFAQFGDLMKEVPLWALNVSSNLQNCDYVNQCGWSKNCYMTIEADENEDSIHCYRVFYVKTCLDCSEVVRSERCYECIDCNRCFNLRYCQLCEQSRDSSLLYDCRSCEQCFGCVGLRQKRFCIFNEQLSQEAYTERMLQFDFCNPEHITSAADRMEKLKIQHPRKHFIGEQNENVSGNYISESKDCLDSFDLRECRDCRYCNMIRESKDCMDFTVWGKGAEKIYEAQCCGYRILNLRFCCDTYEGVYDMTYCLQCVLASAHCFGCIGLKKREYCILNKQYTKEEYEKLVPRIIDHMKSTGEWGEFFPASLSPYAYNETVAQEYFPLTKEEAVQRGYSWQDHLPFTTGTETIAWDQVPCDITQVPDFITDGVLVCEETGKNYRITKQELLLYRQMHVPIPRLHPDVRHLRRMEKRNPRRLWKRACMKCGKDIETTYSPERPEIVYCEECYLKEVY